MPNHVAVISARNDFSFIFISKTRVIMPQKKFTSQFLKMRATCVDTAHNAMGQHVHLGQLSKRINMHQFAGTTLFYNHTQHNSH